VELPTAWCHVSQLLVRYAILRSAPGYALYAGTPPTSHKMLPLNLWRHTTVGAANLIFEFIINANAPFRIFIRVIKLRDSTIWHIRRRDGKKRYRIWNVTDSDFSQYLCSWTECRYPHFLHNYKRIGSFLRYETQTHTQGTASRRERSDTGRLSSTVLHKHELHNSFGKYYKNGHINEDQKGEACSTHSKVLQNASMRWLSWNGYEINNIWVLNGYVCIYMAQVKDLCLSPLKRGMNLLCPR
jgi:hypothetical protein